MEQVDMPGLLRNWKFLRFCKQGHKQGKKQRTLTSGHKWGEGLVSVLASGPSACPKDARDLTQRRSNAQKAMGL
jgi:hypothetical protein